MAESIYPGDNQFAGLVEAATAAADQEVQWLHNDGANGSAQQALECDETQAPSGNIYTHPHSGQYDPSLRSIHNGGESQVVTRPQGRKRKRGTCSISAEDRSPVKEAVSRSTPQQSGPNRTSAGVHSAAALFRAPSTSSKKYTRPPMSKLFASLQLPPEDFLHLQSAAKAYMLDDDHPERRDCVGQRGKTDSDMVKLKLWNCVQEFLDREGNGERFFSVNARKTEGEDGAGTMSWPGDAQQIIKTCVPLLRRMVTNERQRKYAVETRKGGGESKPEDRSQDATFLGHPGPRVTLDKTDILDTLTSEKIDIFGDGLIPDPDEASEWYDVYNADGALDSVFIKSCLPPSLFLPMTSNIDGHCRFYHGDSGSVCNDSCESRLLERLLEFPSYRENASARDTRETVRDMFNIVLTRLIRIHYWKNRANEATATSGAMSITLPQAMSNSSRSPRKKAVPNTTEDVTMTNGQPLNSSLQLLIHIVRQDKCVLPSFDIPSKKCPNLKALRTQVQDHYTLATLQREGVASPSEVALKVWLPDGLVRVEDDGQWMIALLSADTVEWMGGQIRVLLEI